MANSSSATEEALENDVGHEKHTSSSFDHVASNSCCSPRVRRIVDSAPTNSYCIGLPGARFYGGGAALVGHGGQHYRIQRELLRTGSTVMASPSKHGCHYSHNEGGLLSRLFGTLRRTDPKTDIQARQCSGTGGRLACCLSTTFPPFTRSAMKTVAN